MSASRILTRSRATGVFVFSLLMFSAVAFAQISAIEGDVKGPDGAPLKGAKILIERQDMHGIYKGAKTDKKGHYIYNGLPLGTYKVSVLVDEKVADSVNNVRTKLGDPSEVNFDLKQSAQQAQALQKAAQTGELTQEQARGLTKEQREAIEKRAKENAEIMKKNKEVNDAWNAGQEAMKTKDYATAVTDFEKVSTIVPDQVAVWSNLAEADVQLAGTKTGAEQQALLDKGFQAFNKALALTPNDANLHNNYALALVKAKKLPEAQAELQKAAELDPANAGKYYYNLGAILVNTGQNDAAGQAFKKAIDLNPNYADAQYQYGVYLVSKASVGSDGKVTPPPGTVEAFQKYLELEPNGKYAEGAKGMLQTLTGSVSTTYSNPNAPKKPTHKR